MGSRYNRNYYSSPPQQYSGPGSGSSSEPYTLQCDGASKGNPGQAGAGAVLRDPYGNVVFRTSQGLGNTTNNVAEYEALKLGMDQALKSGCTNIRVLTDSNLVSQQVQGSWKVRSDNLIPLNNEIQNMKNNFDSFDIQHVPRGMNSDADSLANAGVNLPEGKIQTEYYGSGRRY